LPFVLKSCITEVPEGEGATILMFKSIVNWFFSRVIFASCTKSFIDTPSPISDSIEG
jgi:hypothetical protein